MPDESIKQRKDKTLRSYITHFNKEALSIVETDDKIVMPTFTNGLRKGKYLYSLYKIDPKTMSDVLYRATKYMNAEDALLALKENPRTRIHRKIHDKKKDGRLLGPETDWRLGAPNCPLKALLISPC